jgi:CHRD domain
MKKLWFRAALTAAMVMTFAGSTKTRASEDDVPISAHLRGLGEVPPTNSKGTAEFQGKISADGTSITFTLKWSGLTTLPLFSHIHFAPTKENGGVMVFLCGGGGKPACTQATSGQASGTITAGDIVGPTAQGIEPAPAGQFADVIRAILTNNAYVNLHTTRFPPGEVRGPVVAQRDDEGDN